MSKETIWHVAGNVSQRMLARYAHIRVQAREDAIAALEQRDTQRRLSDAISAVAPEGETA